jgi:predicted permease
MRTAFAGRDCGTIVFEATYGTDKSRVPGLNSALTEASMLIRDLRVAVRRLAKAPGFSCAAVLMLTLGIGATTGIFSIVEGVLLRPLPFPQPQSLVVLSDTLRGVKTGGDDEVGVTPQDIENYTRDTHSFASLGGYRHADYELSGAGEPAQINAARMTGGVFPALDVAPLMGRFFTQQEDEQKAPVVVLSYELWQKRFHADPHVLGSKILLDRKPYVVIGVMPRNFEFPLKPGLLDQTELWVPMSFTPDELGPTGAASWSYHMVGRLKPEVTTQQARDDAEGVAQETMRNYPEFMSSLHISPVVHSLHEETVREARSLLRVLFLAIFVVMLMACANLAGLLLVRAIRQRREIAMRLALGAGKHALLRQAILESLVLSLTGGVLGLIVAVAGLWVGVGLLPETLPRVSEIGLDWKIVVFAFLLAVLTGIVCGLAPAFAALRTSVNETLKQGGRTGTAGGHQRLRAGLVIAEIAIAMLLLAASGLLLRSFEKMRAVELGFRPDHTLTASYSLPQNQYDTQAKIDEFNRELVHRLQQLPGVQFAGLTSLMPDAGYDSASTFIVDGYVPSKDEGMNVATPMTVEGNYFQAMGIPLLRGRFLSESDAANSQLVVIVNRKFAQHYWPGESPLGKRMRFGTQEMSSPWLTVVGEVADVKEGSPDAPDKQQYYQPVAQVEASAGSLASPTDLNGNSGYIALRTSTPPEQMTNLLQATVRSIDPQLPLSQVQTMEHAVAGSEAPRRFNTALIASFAGAALLLAALGIYSVIAFSAALRAQEMAVRIALGSQRSGILNLVFASAVKLALVGCAIGLLGNLAASRLMHSFLFGVNAFDPLTLSAAVLGVLVLAIAASWLPAYRAASVDPMKALRAD